MTGKTVKIYPAPPISEKEILRYAGGGDEKVSELLSCCLDEIREKLTYKACMSKTEISVIGETVDFGFAKVSSAHLSRNLKDCKKAVIFAATVGIAPDRLIARYCVTSPAKALLFQAIGAERIEALCDAVCAEIENRRPRFSPGYGDLPLDFQRDIFRLLDCERSIGVTLNNSLLMTPSKSVTAIVGIL